MPERLGLKSDGYVHEEMAECFLALGQEEAAAQEFGKAYEILSTDRSLARTEPERIERLRKLARFRD